MLKIVSAGCYHTLAIKNDRSLWGWGMNSSGQIGDGIFSENIHILVVTEDEAEALRLAVSLDIGQTARLSIGDDGNATGVPTVTWESSDENVVIVNTVGSVTATGIGLAMVIAKDSLDDIIGVVYFRVQ